MKAVAVNTIVNCSFQHCVKLLSFQKHLYISLKEIKQTPHPMYIDDSVLEHLDKRLTRVGYKSLFHLIINSLTLVKELKQKGVIPVGITYENVHYNDIAPGQRELNRRRASINAIDDTERNQEAACITMQAMYSLAWLSQNAEDPWELVGIQLYHILIGCGFRIGEVLRLKADALISMCAINETTGKPILDENGNHEVIWGIHYHPEKKAKVRTRWLDKTTAPLVVEAFNSIKETTEPCREQLKYLESSPSFSIRWPHDRISFRELNTHFVTYSPFPKKHTLFNFKEALKNAGIYPVENIVDTVRINEKTRITQPPIQPVYKVDDLNRYFFERAKHYKAAINFKMGTRIIHIKTSELLFVVPHVALAAPENRPSLNRLFPSVITPVAVLNFYGCSKGVNASEIMSIFSRYGLKEEDGSDILIPTHAPRHQLNTFLAIAKVTEHQQAIIMGRNDIQQNRTYQHRSLEDKTGHQVTTSSSIKEVNKISENKQSASPVQANKNGLLVELGATPTKLELQQSLHCFNKPEEHIDFLKEALDANTLLGDLQMSYNTIKKEKGFLAAREFVEVHGRNYHIVPNGSCTRNLAIHGCHKQLRCLVDGGCSHLMITGRSGELESIEKTYSDLEVSVVNMGAMVKSGELKTKRELEQVEKEKYNLSQMAVVLYKAKIFTGYVPIPVFPQGKYLNHTSGKDTVIASFSRDQRKLEEDRNG